MHACRSTLEDPTGDSSGSWLYEALHRFGFSNLPDSIGRNDGVVLTDIYVTAAARCAPPANRPTPTELARCQPYLENEIRLLDRVRIVVTLGHIAHHRWLLASGWAARLGPGKRPKFAHRAEHPLPDGTLLVCSYHPSRQNTNTGRLTREMWHAVWRRVRDLTDGLDTKR